MLSRAVISLALLAVAIAVPFNSFHDRIVGGEDANIEQFPWQVSLVDVDGHFCGGSIIDRTRIVTAAHCVRDAPDWELFIRVRVGSSNRTEGGALRAVRKVIIHEEYEVPTGLNNDIAVLVLKYPLVFSSAVQPIDLPTAGEEFASGTTVVVTGWGLRLLEDETRLPEILQSVAVQIIDQDICVERYSDFDIPVTENMLCAGVLDVGGKDSCQGDSGGPLALIEENRNVLVGVVSWGNDCALETHPGVYTRVSQYLDWLSQAR